MNPNICDSNVEAKTLLYNITEDQTFAGALDDLDGKEFFLAQLLHKVEASFLAFNQEGTI